ncbi:putative kinase [Microbacteriaceae bacterium SG_E_30_P1]|uniref:Kinase n=1 Tax=Antiquaquibacter oligotrophicus TaxID=2880260 RepID=A0ABT6KKQ0_9MICO|nr:AAA family ATPase [Antiquaquibacter oligotrophicus]MDH6180560.1 putative kinase [Antiquaquibacter oligotrophicus]UDF13707.1 ATP-binding protein [Antiquaquibacter oligotrophicus]
MLVVMAGLPGTGKSTIGQVVASRLGIPVVPVDPIETAILQAGIASDQPTGLAAYLVAETLAERVLEAGTGVLIDAVNAVAPAREQWVHLAARTGEPIRFIEVVCSDPDLHRERIESWRRSMPHIQLTWNAVEQSLDDYSEWTGESAAIARITLDSVEPLGTNVERAVAFLQS